MMIKFNKELDLLSKYMEYYIECSEIIATNSYTVTVDYSYHVIHSNQGLIFGIPTFEDFKKNKIILPYHNFKY